MPSKSEYQFPLIARFQANFDDRKQRRQIIGNAADSETAPVVVAQRRRGLDETELRNSVTENISYIINTVDLQSCVDIRDLDYVRRSVLNYGVYDINSMTSEGERVALIEQNVVAAIVSYEPRIVRETVEVTRHEAFDDVSQQLRLAIRADIKSHPIDVEIELVADVDLSLGRVNVTRQGIG